MHNADLYEQCNSVQKRDVIAFLDMHVPKMLWKKHNIKILDVGCGDGSVTSILKKYLPTDSTLVGSDISENMVTFATQNYSNKQTSFTVLDISGYLPEAMTRNFNCVFSFYALHWVLDQKRAFKNIFNLLDQDGTCSLIFLARCSVFDAYRVLSQDSKWDRWIYDPDRYISPYQDCEEPDKEVMKLMENTGFVNIQVECKDKVFWYEDIEVFKKLLMAVNPFNIPKDLHDDFLKDYIEILKDIDRTYRVKHNENTPVGLAALYYNLVTVIAHKPSSIETLGFERDIIDRSI